MKKPKNQILVIFGASGDLTKRKLIPALYDLFRQNLLPDNFIVLGVSRTNFSDEEFRENSCKFINDNKKLNVFKRLLFYQQLSPANADDFNSLKIRIKELSRENNLAEFGNFFFSSP